MEEIFNKELILNYLKEHNINEQTFCKMCKIPDDTITKIIDNNLDIDIFDIARIVKFLNIPFFKIFKNNDKSK